MASSENTLLDSVSTRVRGERSAELRPRPEQVSWRRLDRSGVRSK
jgi:hypothetical protein